MRNAFIDQLILHAKKNEKIFLIVGDLGFSVIEPFVELFPDRFLNAGVAEQNMMGMAAGIASEGYHVFVYSIANFPTFRCAEQIRNDVDYHKLPVTIVSTGGGLGYGNLGYSHHAIQDYGLMRMFPNMIIAAPGDPMEVRGCVNYLVKNPQPSYLRLGKSGEPCLHETIPEINPGEWLQINKNKERSLDKTILTTGGVLFIANQWLTSEKYRDYSLHSIPLWGMSLKSTQEKKAQEWNVIVTIEDHLRDCGFGSWFGEAIHDISELNLNHKVISLDSNVCGLVGSQSELNKLGGLFLEN